MPTVSVRFHLPDIVHRVLTANLLMISSVCIWDATNSRKAVVTQGTRVTNPTQVGPVGAKVTGADRSVLPNDPAGATEAGHWQGRFICCNSAFFRPNPWPPGCILPPTTADHSSRMAPKRPSPPPERKKAPKCHRSTERWASTMMMLAPSDCCVLTLTYTGQRAAEIGSSYAQDRYHFDRDRGKAN